ncbi:hypothetical protein LWC35_19160 [Pseudonocardia kujensis]|uniref:hypothetical protein n=1 Tax=Pseudonocardia kujensis TaxID=1128675 RepID=UPI001E2B41E2|nr:hypothetical protein [Pseudonocardia kujensis]MCE0765003.1 hypothetical protein [Pseudonocardia kujensis]
MVSRHLAAATALVRVYLAIAGATLAVLGVLAATAPARAPREAWGHAVISAVFGVVLPLRAARRGNPGALRAVGLIASALLVVNVVEAGIPGFVLVWMRVEMVGIAVLMAAMIGLVIREQAVRR